MTRRAMTPHIATLVVTIASCLTFSTLAEAAERCKSGYVWRERFEGDAVCVRPEERFRLEDGTCRSGYVWRDSFPGDGICVTPAERAAAKAKKNSPSTGGAGSESEYCPNGKTKEGICFF
jgi:hypothetical protein